ncbi:EcsC family protein, partial [Staphylococcus aureus]|nr:EcsC family protein [Staphylococcus aureus]
MTEDRTDLERQLRDIQKWEKAQQRAMFWQTFTRLPFQLLDKLTPQFIQRKIGLILDETGTFIQSGGQYLTSEKRIMKKFQK